MKRRLRPLLFFTTLALLLFGCRSQPEVMSSEQSSYRFSSDPAPAMAPAPAVMSDGYEMERAAAQAGSALPPSRLIIRTGELRLVVRDTEEGMAAINALVHGREGWVVTSNIQQRGEAKAGNMTVRIPATQFDATLADIKEMALEVTLESTSGQDVTEEFVDLSARLANLEATAARVRNFLDSARNVEEALNVNRELSRLESEIEAMKGRLQYLEQSAAFSTLTIYLTPDSLAQPLQIGSWRPQGTARDALQALISTLQGVADVAIWLTIYMLPLLLVIFGPIALVIRLVVNRRRRRKEAVA